MTSDELNVTKIFTAAVGAFDLREFINGLQDTEFDEHGYDKDGFDRHGFDEHGRYWDPGYRLYL